MNPMKNINGSNNKWKVNATFYSALFGKAVIMTRAKLGFLGMYNPEIGMPRLALLSC
jgi:hypothetical protein